MKKRFFLPVLLAALCACNAEPANACPDARPGSNTGCRSAARRCADAGRKGRPAFHRPPDALDLSLSQETINDAKADGVTTVTERYARALQQYPVGGICQFGKNIESPSQLVRFNKELQDASAAAVYRGG